MKDRFVCISIFGFHSVVAFVVRNSANLVPQFESGQCETNPVIEFPVNNFKVENILFSGHSWCGGIPFMSMEDGIISSFMGGEWEEFKVRNEVRCFQAQL